MKRISSGFHASVSMTDCSLNHPQALGQLLDIQYGTKQKILFFLMEFNILESTKDNEQVSKTNDK